MKLFVKNLLRKMCDIVEKFPRCARIPVDRIYFSDLRYLRRAGFRHENRIYFQALTTLTENPAKIGRIYFAFVRHFNGNSKGFIFQE